MNSAEKGAGAYSMAVATVSDASDTANSPNVEATDENAEGFAENRAGENDEPKNPSSSGGGLLLDQDSARDHTTPTSPIDSTTVEDSPYEHNFEPGDHIIRWDMLPILWPIQIHGIVLEVSKDKSEVTICDFGITSGKEGKKIQIQQEAAMVEEENTKFVEALQEECQDANNDEPFQSDASTAKNTPKKQRLTVIKLTKWSDLRKWHKINYEGGLLNAARGGGVGKGLKNLGNKTQKWWSSMTKLFAKNDVTPHDNEKVWRSVRYDVDERGFCAHHPPVQLKQPKDDGSWAVVRKKCPECIMEDCPAMMGEDRSLVTSLDSAPSFSRAEDEHSVRHSKITTPGESPLENKTGESSQSSIEGNDDSPLESRLKEADDESFADNAGADSESDTMDDETKTLHEMISDANEVEKRSRHQQKTSPERPSMGKETPWRRSFLKSSGAFMKSLSNIVPQQNKDNTLTSEDSTSEEMKTEPLPGKSLDSEEQSTSVNDLPRSDPPVLVLARTRFILEHGESVLPPYHIVNSNSECIAVWCKTGRWSTFQAAVFLHSTAIGNAKSATALTLGMAAVNPWLIPAFAAVGVAAVGAPWLMLKFANDKWSEATASLTEQFWMQAEPEVFLECIEKWGNIQ